MKRIPIYMLLILLVSISTQCKTIVKQQSLPQVGNKTGLLWRISGNELKAPSYLYGTIHLIPAEKFFLPEGTEAAMDTAEVLFLEVDMTMMEDPTTQLKIMQGSFMKDNMSLSDLLTEEEYSLVKSHFKEMGIPIFFLERLKPIFLTVFADGSINPNSIQEGTHKVYELEFTEMAEKQEMEVKGLESFEFQLNLMDSIPYKDQAKMLLESIRGVQEEQMNYDSLVNLYLSQDLTAMLNRTEEDQDLGESESLLLDDRNENWIPEMEKSMKRSSCFFAVGAAHLAGPNGVIRLLEQKGYTLNPVLLE